MKKLLLLISFITLSVTCQAKNIEIDIDKTRPESIGARSVISKPAVSFDDNLQRLEVSYSCINANFTMSITDESGVVIYRSSLMTDGTSHAYMLGVLSSGTYTILIESKGETFEGEFFI